MGYSSPFGKSSIFIPDDSEFYHGPAIVNVGKVIRDLVSYSQSSSKLYFLRSNFLVVSNSERYRVYDGEQWRDLNIHAEISNLEGNVDINANSAVLRADAPDFGGDGTVYKLYIPFAEQNGTGGEIEYAFCVYSTDLYDFLWFIDMVFEGVRETVFRHLWNFAKRDMERTGGDERKVAQWYQNNSPWILVGISEEERIKHLSIIINSKRAVNTVGTNEEKAVLNLLDSFKPAYNNDTNIAKSLKELESTPATKLLKALLRANGGGDILFERLYSRMNNFFGAKNFTKCIQVLFMLWENSIFLLPDNALYNGNTAPDNIPYSSQKKLGFYTSNFKLTRNKEKIDVKKEKLVTVPQQLPDMPETKAIVFEDFATYHLYQPVLAIEPERPAIAKGEQSNAQKSEIPVPQCAIPAFYLLAAEDHNFWANFQFGMQIGIEIITTVSGVGNLFKLRHLKSLTRLPDLVVVLGSIQVVSGTIGIMLNFVDENDAKYGPFCNKLRDVLIWIDLASLGADAIASKLLRDAAKEALEESRKLKLVLEEEAERATKEAEKAAEIAKDEAEIQKIQNELKKIAGEEKIIGILDDLIELTDEEIQLLISSIAVRNKIKGVIELKLYRSAKDSSYVVKYKGEKIYSSSAQYFKEMLEDVMSNSHVTKKLDELLSFAKLRKAAYADFVKAFAKADIDKLIEHIFEGHIGNVYVHRVGSVPGAKGIHSIEAEINGHARIVTGTKRPPTTKYNEIYTAEVQKKNAGGTWIDKVRPDGRKLRSTFFPDDWDQQRIMEEVAFAWKNGSQIGNGHEFLGLSTTGFDIKLVINNGIIKTAYPIMP